MNTHEIQKIEMNESEYLEGINLDCDGMLMAQTFVRRVPGGWIYEYFVIRYERCGRIQAGVKPEMVEVEVTAMSTTFVPEPAVPTSSW